MVVVARTAHLCHDLRARIHAYGSRMDAVAQVLHAAHAINDVGLRVNPPSKTLLHRRVIAGNFSRGTLRDVVRDRSVGCSPAVSLVHAPGHLEVVSDRAVVVLRSYLLRLWSNLHVLIVLVIVVCCGVLVGLPSEVSLLPHEVHLLLPASHVALLLPTRL